MKEAIRSYYVKFSVDTLHTESEIKAYSEADAETLLKKQYSDSKVVIIEIERMSDKK